MPHKTLKELSARVAELERVVNLLDREAEDTEEQVAVLTATVWGLPGIYYSLQGIMRALWSKDQLQGPQTTVLTTAWHYASRRRHVDLCWFSPPARRNRQYGPKQTLVQLVKTNEIPISSANKQNVLDLVRALRSKRVDVDREDVIRSCPPIDAQDGV
jgi:hypothetical protein